MVVLPALELSSNWSSSWLTHFWPERRVVLTRPCWPPPRAHVSLHLSMWRTRALLLRSLSHSLPLHLLCSLAMGRAKPRLPPRALCTLLLPMSRHLSMPLPRPPSMPQYRCHGRPSQHTLAVSMAEPKRELGAATVVSAALNYQAAVAYPSAPASSSSTAVKVLVWCW
jgi:hypothetical protein